MRKIAWVLLVLFVFSIPWEYSLDFRAPFGNIARLLGLATAFMGIAAGLQTGSFKRPCSIHWAILAFYLWFCCTFFWTVAADGTLAKLRGYAQEMMLVWLVWELVEDATGLFVLLRAWLAGSSVLAALTIASFLSSGSAGEQVRFMPMGQDPNDAARFLAFGFPIAMIVSERSSIRFERAIWLAYFPVGSAAVLLTASRGGLLMTIVVLVACGLGGLWRRGKAMVATGLLMGASVILVSVVAPTGTLNRLGTSAELLQASDLNQRVNIWSAGWRAFQDSPLFGHGAGTFATAAELFPEDTAHNTVVSILVEGGLCGLALALSVVVLTVRAALKARGELRAALVILMLAWALSSITGTVWENRMTWLLFGVAAVGWRVGNAGDDQVECAIVGAEGDLVI
ncbi:MAG: O-antigen ligase family protein [Acidobacteria bacterium]|nr:O-antigen ligase family protein [Acidobacteriota bacterium]